MFFNLKIQIKLTSVLFLFFAQSALCANETLFSNWTIAVAPGQVDGALWVYSRGDVNSGFSLLNLTVDESGKIKVEKSDSQPVDNEVSAVQSKIEADKKPERRRIPTEFAGELGEVFPMYEMDDNGNFLIPKGFFSATRVGLIDESPLDLPTIAENVEDAMDYAPTGFAYDSTKKILWIAQGILGVLKYDISKGAGNPAISRKLLNKNGKWEDLKNNSIKIENYLDVLDLAIDKTTGSLWIATKKGLYVQSSDEEIANASKVLEMSRVSGVWLGGNPLQIIAETASDGKESKPGLWRKFTKESSDFKKVDFLDSLGQIVKKDVYANSNYTVTNVAFIEKEAFVGVWVTGGVISGYLRVDEKGVRAHKSIEGKSENWLYGFDMNVTDRDALITSITTFPLKKNVIGLAVATYGNGISVSADKGETWTPILNRAKLSGNLGTVRMVPSVIFSAGEESLVSYKVSQKSKITIEVFSYDMKKVRTIVKSKMRSDDISRSSNPKEDFWDGRDDYGRVCAMGIYYVRVKDNHGHIGWGKVMTMGGER